MTSEQRSTYNVQSPTHSHYSYSHSPKNLSARQLSLSNSSTLPHPSGFGSSMAPSQPTSPTAPSLPPMNAAKHTMDGSINTYYGPTTDRDDRLIGRNGIQHYEPYQSHQRRRSYNRYELHHNDPTNHSAQYPPSLPPDSPSRTYHYQHSRSQMNSQAASPVSPKPILPYMGGAVPLHTTHVRRVSSDAPGRTADPMSLSSIMSGSDNDRVTPVSRSVFESPNGMSAVGKRDALVKKEVDAQPPMPESPIRSDKITSIKNLNNKSTENGITTKPHMDAGTILDRPPSPTEKEIEAEMCKIDQIAIPDPNAPAFEKYRLDWKERTRKRVRNVEAKENYRRKRRRTSQMMRFHDIFGSYAALAKEQYIRAHSDEAWQEVQEQEIANEKERKKDMQRKRRREKTLMSEYQKRDEAIEKAQQAADEEEKERFIKDAQKAEKKAKATSQLLHGGLPSKEFKEVAAHGPNLGGGTMSSFQMSDDPPKEPSTKRGSGRLSNRPKKSKEQKQAEKDSAAAAQAALERGDGLPVIAPKEPAQKELRKKEKEIASKQASEADVVPYVSKAYNQLYESIWKDLSKKDINRVLRVKENTLVIRQSNLRKTAQLASKEARRWQLRTNKSMKDVQARAKRSMREMLSFWKRNEREERDQRKLAERQELENARKAEADREANRQKRKLNFLISQTELYSHFIGKKVKTDEVERSTDDVAASNQPAITASSVDEPDMSKKPGSKVTNFEDLDFDDEDETNLRQAAMANAQNAVKEAQDRARAFNDTDGQTQSQSDDEELNFQNPTSLQNMDVPQPKMLSCQLKEYQLKGLNWLVNLYEQGINGILADEMGLGKTVQSISVMAYLAEHHDLWGPFLVIAPASTLHNWQQEITRFVPDLKVLPYWGNAKDRKVLRKFWDRKHITYRQDSPFHVLVTSYQLVVQDAQYFQKIRWQYMILDEAQAIKSSQSSRWKSLLGFYCRNRLLLTGTPIQNNMQELWALLHFIMPSLFDSHDEFSDWFSKDIESHAQSNTKLNEDQLKRLHMILKPFMLRRIKKHVQKELGDKIELDVFCDLTYRQRAYYSNLRNKISIMDLIEKAAVGDDQDTATLMNLVMQFRKVCNHPDLFERADIASPLSFSHFADTVSFIREGQNVNVGYSVRNPIEFTVPRLIGDNGGRIDLPGPSNSNAGWLNKLLLYEMSIWNADQILQSSRENGAFSWLRFVDKSAGEVSSNARNNLFQRIFNLRRDRSDVTMKSPATSFTLETEGKDDVPLNRLMNIVDSERRGFVTDISNNGPMYQLMNVSKHAFEDTGLDLIEQCGKPRVSAPPVELYCASQNTVAERAEFFFNVPVRRALYGVSEATEQSLLDLKIDPDDYPISNMLPAPDSKKARFNNVQVPSMRRFVTDSGKLAQLDRLLKKLKDEGHRVLLYFQMTRMIDLMEEYLTYRNYKYCRLDGSTKLEDRRDTVADFQTRPEIFVFLLSTRAGGLGINLTSADTVIFYDSDWNPTIDSQAMDRAHRLGQTKQVTVYRMITRGTIEERIRKRALQKEEVQRVVITGGASGGVDFNTRSRENRTKDIAMWLADDDQAAEIEKKEAEMAAAAAEASANSNGASGGRKKKGGQQQQQRKKADMSLDDMYHEGEGNFDDGSTKPSGAATPVPGGEADANGGGNGNGSTNLKRKSKGVSKKAKTLKQRLAIVDGGGDA